MSNGFCLFPYHRCAKRGGKKVAKKMPQNRTRVRGRGDYSEEVKQLADPVQRIERKIDHINSVVDKGPASAGSLIGRGLGSLIGQGDLGASAGSALSKWFGMGDYELKSNSLIKPAHGERAMIPVFSKDGKRGIRVCEREYVADVISPPLSNAFGVTSYRINPGDSSTFPWLSRLAPCYEEYEINGLIFEYKTTSAMYNGVTQALGTVTMMTDYDPTDPAPGSLVVMQNAAYSCSTVSCNNLDHGVECEPSERSIRVLYVSPGQPDPDQVRFTDLANFFLAVSGVNGTNVNLGQLWVSYDITFYKKQLVDVLNPYLQLKLSPTGIGTTTPFGSAPSLFALPSYGTLEYQISTLNPTRIRFPGAKYGIYAMMYQFVDSVDCTAIGFTITALQDVTTVFAPNLAHTFSTVAGTTGGAPPPEFITTLQYFEVTGPAPTLSLNMTITGIGTAGTSPIHLEVFYCGNEATNFPSITSVSTGLF